jgi:nitrous oxide reductase accessory protein NosL
VAVDLMGFDASKVEPNTRSLIPKGEYQAVIVSSEKKPTKAGNGHTLEIEIQIVDGDHKGQTLRTWLNLWNQSEQAKQIAQGTLSSICRAVNVLTPQSSEQLHHKQLTAVIDVDTTGESPRNNVKGFKPRQSAQPFAAPAATTGKANPFG